MKTLREYRDAIDELDNQIIALLQKRYDIVRNVGHHKAQTDLDVVQTARVYEVLERVKGLARKHNLEPDFISDLYQLMIDHAHDLESGIRKNYEQTKARK